MEFQDIVLSCVDCGADFVFTAGEQIFFQEKKFNNPPKRCRPCKAKHLATLPPAPARSRNFNRSTAKIETQATCSQCGKETTVPFKPTQGRPVFCRDCYQNKNQFASA
jgi:CxxC-x17-CxxC domain-containing protein